MSQIRGGKNSTQIRVGQGNISSYSEQSDIVFSLNERALPHLKRYDRLNKSTLVVGEEENITPDMEIPTDRILKVPFTDIANEVSAKIYSNTVAVGFLSALFEVEEEKVNNMSKLALGVFYQDTSKPSFSEASGVYDSNNRPLFKRNFDREKLEGLITSMK